MAKKKLQAFFICPLKERGSAVRRRSEFVEKEIIINAIGDDFEVRNADEIPGRNIITDSIIANLKNADLVIADLTDLNPNVFYELGIRHHTGKPTILFAAVGTELPFDIGNMPVIFYPLSLDYSSVDDCRELLKKDVIALMKQFSENLFCKNIAFNEQDLFSQFQRVRETTMLFYNVHAVVKGTVEDCERGTALITYTGSALVDSPHRPVIFEDRVKNYFPIKSHKFFPKETVIKEDEFKRNPTVLEYRITAENPDEKLFMTGEVVANCQLGKKWGGLGLHIPYVADCVCFLLDISAVPFLKEYGGTAFVVRRGRDGKDHRFNEAQTVFNEENLTYSITARNVPADSNITFEWGFSVENDETEE